MAKYFGGSTYEDLARAFSRMDADGDGYLTWDELVEGASHYQRTTGSGYRGGSAHDERRGGAPLSTLYTLYARGMRTACARHVHGMCAACARHVHCIYTGPPPPPPSHLHLRPPPHAHNHTLTSRQGASQPPSTTRRDTQNGCV